MATASRNFNSSASTLAAGALRRGRGGAFGFADLAFAPENPVREFRHFGFECLDLLVLFQQALQSALMHALVISGLLPVMDRRSGGSDFFLLPSLSFHLPSLSLLLPSLLFLPQPGIFAAQPLGISSGERARPRFFRVGKIGQ